MKHIEYRQDIHYQAPFYYTRQEFRTDSMPYPEHNHDFYEFFLIVSGRIRHCFNGREIVLNPGALQLIRPDDTHQLLLAPGCAETAFYNCNIRKEEFILLFSFLTGSDRCSIDDLVQTVDLAASPEFPGLVRRIEKIVEYQYLANHPQYLRNAISRSILTDVISVLLEKTVGDDLRKPEWLRMVFTEMRKPENFTAGLPRMLELAGRSREHLSRSFRQYYGVAPREYLLELKLLRVSDLLVQRRFSILEAANLAGFDNLAYFRKCFRSRFGVTPRLFRRRYENI